MAVRPILLKGTTRFHSTLNLVFSPHSPLILAYTVASVSTLVSRMLAEIFQKKVGDAIRGIVCVKNISDDIYVGGVDRDTHDQHLLQVFCQLHENGPTINLPKCQFRVPTMIFFYHVFSEKGMLPDPAKVKALQSVAPPI